MKNLIHVPGQAERERGTLEQCPFCGFQFPKVHVNGTDQLVPVQANFVVGLEPIANVTGGDRRGVLSDLLKMAKTCCFVPRPVLVQHSEVCPGFAAFAGARPPINIAAGPPPPMCECGHAWTAHQHHEVDEKGNVDSEGGDCNFAECSCGEYRPIGEGKPS